jgi:hypothetical protein
MIIYLKFAPCGQLVPKGEKILFTKIELKEGEAQRGRIDKRRGSTKILSTQVGEQALKHECCISMCTSYV